MGNDFKDLFGDWHPDDEGNEGVEGEVWGANGRPRDSEERPYRALNEKEAHIVNVFEIDTGNPLTNTIFVLLRDNYGREFKIFVARDVALAISMAKEQERPDRPYTHDLMKSMLDRLGARVERVTIDDLWQDTYYAKITVVQTGIQGETSFDIDARPSDAMAMSLRYRVPIYVAESILEQSQQE